MKRSFTTDEGKHEYNFVAASHHRNFGVVRRRMEHEGLPETRTFFDQAVSRFADFNYLNKFRTREIPFYRESTRKDLLIYYSIAISYTVIHSTIDLRLQIIFRMIFYDIYIYMYI